MHFFALSLAVALHLSLLPYCTPAALWESPFPPPLSPIKLGLVRDNAINISTRRSVRSSAAPLVANKLTDAAHSWELGTLAEALTEFEWWKLGVFAPDSIPPPDRLAPDQAADVLSIAEKYVGITSLIPYFRDEVDQYADATWRRFPG
ncbi:hypothetical protein BJY52DRAFT_359303 [Lactarius psammicola]|nr:hypothetical protein BJY52DRAFT_359303 [Lactarius psammicola]